MNGSSSMVRGASSIVRGRQDRQAVPDEDALLDERARRPKAPVRFQGVHVDEVLGNEGLDCAGRRSDTVDRDEQRLLQHRRKQFRDGFPGVVGQLVLRSALDKSRRTA